MKNVLKLVALAIAGACIPVYAYLCGQNDATDEFETNMETVTYPDGTVVTKWGGGVVASAEPIDEDEEDSLGADTQ